MCGKTQSFFDDNLIEFKVYSKEANKAETEKVFEMHVELFTTFGIFHAEKSEWKDTVEFKEIIRILKEQLEQLNKHDLFMSSPQI